MKLLNYLSITILLFLLGSCSESVMDNINKDVNHTSDVDASTLLPAAIVRTAFETAGTDIAWYASVYVEHSAGTYGQSRDADKRVGQEAGSLMNNNFVSTYSILNICKEIQVKTSETGATPNPLLLGISQILTAYNLSVLTDMWGEVPWSEALQGKANIQPKFDKQSKIYGDIIKLLDDAISNIAKGGVSPGSSDYIYGGNAAKWTKAAWSLKARYFLRLTNRDNDAATKALNCISKGFTNQSEALMFHSYEATAKGENPWYQFLNDRSYLSSSKTIYTLMNDRNDPRMSVYFTKVGGNYVAAPNGTAEQTQGGLYSTSLITENGKTIATPIMTYHELKFIEAEAKLRKNDPTWVDAFKSAVIANFDFHGASGGETYFTSKVLINIGATLNDNLKELITQKFIAFYEHEAIEAYNDYRRTGIPTLNNPQNQTVGFVNRFPYGEDESSANGSNVPDINIYKDKVWWAGGNEK